MITTKEIASLLPSEYTHEMLALTMIELRSIPDFGKIARIESTMVDDTIATVYHLSLNQAICLITEVDNGKLVWLVREVIALENKERLPLWQRRTEEEMDEIDNHQIIRDYKFLTKALHSISATMDMVQVTIGTLKRFKEDPTKHGTVSLSTFTDLFTEATDTTLDSREVFYLLLNTLKVKHKDVLWILDKENKIIIDLVGLVDYLDDMMLDAIYHKHTDRPLRMDIQQEKMEELV